MLISDVDEDGGLASKDGGSDDGGSDDGDGGDDVHVIASTPRRLNFLCLVSFDGIPCCRTAMPKRPEARKW